MISVVMGILIFVLIAGASPHVWVDDHVCGGEMMTAAFHMLRPQHVLASKEPPEEDYLHISLEKVRELYVVKVGRGESVVIRSFADPGNCEAAGQTAALIADGALDDLPPPKATVALEKPPPPPVPRPGWSFSGLVGLGARQSLLGPAMTLMASAAIRQGLFETLFEVEWGLPNRRPLYPEGSRDLTVLADSFYLAQALTPILMEGIGFQAGPGRLSIRGEIGVELTFLSVNSATTIRQRPPTISEPFLGVRLAYTVDFGRYLFFAIGLEERFAPALARFQVEGVPSHVTTRTWTLAGSGALGVNFF